MMCSYFERMHFDIAVVDYFPYLRLRISEGHLKMTGPLAEVFHILSMRLNFTYTLHKEKDNLWGTHGPDGWNGMLGMVDKNEVDMAVGPFTLTYDRWSSFKLSDPVYVDNIEILVPAPEWKMTLFGFVTVFSIWVWIAIFIALLSMTLVVTVVEKYKDENISFHLHFLKNFWLSFVTLLQKGSREKPDYYLQSLLSLLWMLSTLVIASIFGTILLTRLLIKRVHRIDSLEDLVASPGVQPILEYQSSVFNNFRDTEAETFRKIYQRVLANPDIGIQTFTNISTIGMDFVTSGKAAMITDGAQARGFMVKRLKEGRPCNYWVAKEMIGTMWKVIAFSRAFPDHWLEKINHQLRHILESGWLQARIQKELWKYEDCLASVSKDRISLGFDHIRGIFFIWLFGCGTAVFVFFIECLKVHSRDILSWGEKTVKVRGTTKMYGF